MAYKSPCPELFESLKSIANRKQEEMKDMIVATLNNMKDELLEDAANMEFKEIILQSGEPVCSRDIKCCIGEIQDLIITRLNLAVANKLISSVDYLRESCVGTLARCLESLERSQQETSSSVTSNHLKQILNAAYHGDINWNCPCLGGMASGPCGEQFKSAFSCFHYSTEEVKGSDCVEQFRGMQECMQKYPDLYPQEDEEEEKENQGIDEERLPPTIESTSTKEEGTS